MAVDASFTAVGARAEIEGRQSVAVSSAPVWAMALVVAALLPEDLNIRPAGLLLTPPRIVLFAALPTVIVKMVQHLGRPDYKFGWTDYIVPLAAFWMFLAISMTEGFDRALTGASVLILEFAGAYYLIRATVTEPSQTMVLARFMAWAFAICACLAIFDVISERFVFHELTNAISGYGKEWRSDYRNGIMRGQGTLEHPIMLGTVAAIGVILSIISLRGPARIVTIALCAVGLVSAMSSAPIGALVLGLALLGYRRIMTGYENRWRTLIIVSTVFLVALLTLHPRPFSFLMDHLTFDPATGYYRLLIWNIVGDIVLQNWVFGVGFSGYDAEEYGMSYTVDSIWLNSALVFGIPGSALIGAVMLSACHNAVDRVSITTLSAADKTLGVALSIAIFFYIYLGFTVHFWGCNWILMGLFAGLRTRLGVLAASRGHDPAQLPHTIAGRR